MKTVFLVLVLFLACVECRLQFLALGDWGDTSLTRQERVADVMDKFCETEQCDFIVTTGDNFYNDGVESVDDPRWNDSWRNVYDGDNIADLTWYVSVGNHDHTLVSNNELNQVEFSEIEPRWKLPWLWHDEYFQVEEDVMLHLILMDSESMWTRKHNVTAQEIWLEETLASSVGDYVILVAHHPSYSVGDYFGNIVTRDYLDPLLEEFEVDVYLTGHDHNMQHILPINETVPFPTEHVISGAGGRRPYAYSPINDNLINRAGYYSVYFGELNGFSAFDIDGDEMRVSHYTFEENDAGEDEPVKVYEFSRPRVRG